jgi:hypothetical protein
MNSNVQMFSTLRVLDREEAPQPKTYMCVNDCESYRNISFWQCLIPVSSSSRRRMKFLEGKIAKNSKNSKHDTKQTPDSVRGRFKSYFCVNRLWKRSKIPNFHWVTQIQNIKLSVLRLKLNYRFLRSHLIRSKPTFTHLTKFSDSYTCVLFNIVNL